VLLGGRLRRPFLFSAFVTTLHVADFSTGEDHAQVMRRWVVAETNVEAIDVKVDVVLAGADDEE